MAKIPTASRIERATPSGVQQIVSIDTRHVGAGLEALGRAATDIYGDIKKKDLAKRLGKSPGYITQLLDGRANMTLRTVSNVMLALDSSLSIGTHSVDFRTYEQFDEQVDIPENSFVSDEETKNMICHVFLEIIPGLIENNDTLIIVYQDKASA